MIFPRQLFALRRIHVNPCQIGLLTAQIDYTCMSKTYPLNGDSISLVFSAIVELLGHGSSGRNIHWDIDIDDQLQL